MKKQRGTGALELTRYAFHAEEANVLSHIAQRIQGMTESFYNEFVCKVNKAWEHRCFVGFLTLEQLQNVEHKLIVQNTPCAFVYMSNTELGRFVMVYCDSSTTSFRWRLKIISLEDEVIHNPFDRGEFFYFKDATQAAAKEAIECWLLCAKRLNFYRDIRVTVAKLMWKEYFVWMP
jgi:hypothetical protein